MTTRNRICLILFLATSSLAAQAKLPQIPKKEVAATLKFLSSDALMGRDTPSPGLEQAASHIRGRFKNAGLKAPGNLTDFYTYYEREGSRVALADSVLKVRAGGASVTLQPDKDFRYLRVPPGGYDSSGMQGAARMKLEDAARKGLWSGRPITKPLLVEAPEESDLWRSCAGDSVKLKSRRRASKRADAPVILIRQGLLKPGAVSVELRTPAAASSKVRLKNVIGMVPGREIPDEYVLVSAHYDHIGTGIPRGSSSDTINNGADDNATGTTAILELAELYAALPPEKRCRRSLLFVCFSGEEKGLLGSRAMAENPPVALSRVVANINIEMIGRPSKGQKKCAWVTGADRSDFAEIAGTAFKRAGIKLVDFPMAAQLYRASDNYPFAQKGVVAHSISAGSLHKDYHRPTDEFKKIDLPHMTAIINGLAEVVREFGDRSERPRPRTHEER